MEDQDMPITGIDEAIMDAYAERRIDAWVLLGVNPYLAAEIQHERRQYNY